MDIQVELISPTIQVELLEPIIQVEIPAGNIGDNGKSAYQLWLDDGNTGTLSDFFIWLGQEGIKALPFYLSDTDAIADGLTAGDIYRAEAGHEAAAYGTVLTVQA